jgi:(1->4)-alpha-D-glucan 1-alpha-D-glucosylmutase
VVAAQRLAASGTDGSPTLELPPGRWHDLLSGASLEGQVRLRTLFDRLPVALLVAETNPVGTEA